MFPLLPFRLLFCVLSVPRPFFLCQVADDDRSLLPALECLASIVIAVGGALDVSVLSQPGVLSQPVAVQADLHNLRAMYINSVPTLSMFPF